MPIYEYACNACGHELELLQGFRDEPTTTCPACRRDQLKRKISAAAFHLKGTGWYETDFKNKDKKEAEKKESTEDKPETKKESTDSVSKEEKKTEKNKPGKKSESDN